jgi:hypothetical protein
MPYFKKVVYKFINQWSVIRYYGVIKYVTDWLALLPTKIANLIFAQLKFWAGLVVNVNSPLFKTTRTRTRTRTRTWIRSRIRIIFCKY